MRALSAVALVLLTAIPVVAHAQEETDFDALVARAVQHYASREYEPAIELFEQAYSIRAEPELVYNIARSYERLARSEEAIREYRRFVELPGTTSDLRARAFASIEALREEQRRREAIERANEPPPPDPEPQVELTPEPAPEVQPTPAPRGGNDALSISGWTIFGVGVAAVLTGAVFGGIAMDRDAAFDEATDYQTKLGLYGEVRDYALVTDVLLFAGGAVALSGLIMGIVGTTSGGDSPSVSVLAGPGLAGISIDSRF